jgi:hypothetical protein
MSDYPVTRGSRSGDPHPTLRLAALTAVIAGVILVAVAAFLLSYEGIHQIALQAGVSPTLARLYPLMFDAMLVIACAATLALRNAGWGARCYVWVSLLLLVGAMAVGDAFHATGVSLTGQPARAVIAVIPWVLLLMGFGIWLVMLRQWRRARAMAAANGGGGPAGQAAAGSAAAAGAVTWAASRGTAPARTGAPGTGLDTLLERPAARAPQRPAAVEGPAAGGRATAEGQPGGDPGQAGHGAAQGDGRDMPSGATAEGGVTFEALPAGHAGAAAGPRAQAEGAASGEDSETHEAGARAGSGDHAGPPPMVPAPAPVPHFDRPRSTPTPPQEPGTDGE